jgi:phosphotransferase system HPr (HPr) family protein
MPGSPRQGSHRMRVAELEVHNRSGLHARPAAMFVKTASAFRASLSVVNLTRGTNPANAKSLLAVLGCGVEMGHQIKVSAEGEDEEAAIEAVRALAAGGFGEAVAG